MAARRFVAQLKARAPLTSRVHRLRFVADEPLRWAAGQYVVVVHGQGQELFLPYSLANAHDPAKPTEFELAVAIQAGAEVLDGLPINAELQLEGPAGEFTWQPSPSPSALFVGVGTGISPLRALIEEELARRSNRRLLLLAGHRAPEDVLFATDFASWAREQPRFRVMPTLTAGGKEWTGLHGRVQAQLRRAVAELAPLDAYVCGRLDMVSEVAAELEAHGVPRERIRSEGF